MHRIPTDAIAIYLRWDYFDSVEQDELTDKHMGANLPGLDGPSRIAANTQSEFLLELYAKEIKGIILFLRTHGENQTLTKLPVTEDRLLMGGSNPTLGRVMVTTVTLVQVTQINSAWFSMIPFVGIHSDILSTQYRICLNHIICVFICYSSVQLMSFLQ
jgi:hypothetical protein